MLFGYARVSTAEQNPDHQIDALLQAGVAANDIHVDHASGAKASRPALDTVLRMLRDGDKITRLNRLGRSVLHLVTLGAELRERGVGLHITKQGIEKRPRPKVVGPSMNRRDVPAPRARTHICPL